MLVKADIEIEWYTRKCGACGFTRGEHRGGDHLCPAICKDGTKRADRWNHRGEPRTWFTRAPKC